MSKSNTNQDNYNALSWFYNKYWTTSAPELFDFVFERILYPYTPMGGSVLDLCCGTGQLANILSNRGYAVTGLDISEDLLVYAKKNAPDAVFVHGDATKFKFKNNFDAIVSAFDSMNHLLDKSALTDAFTCVYKSLKVGGRFVFDVNGVDSFDDEWTEGFSIVEENNVCIVKPDFDEDTNLCNYNITVFNKSSNRWDRDDILIQERYYTVKEIMDTLSKAGFHSLQMLDGVDDLGVEGFKGRIFFIGIK